MKHRHNFRFYLILLGAAYFTMLYIFHGNLQAEIRKDCVGASCLKYFTEREVKSRTSSIDIQRHVLEIMPETADIDGKPTTEQHIIKQKLMLNNSLLTSSQRTYKKCFLPPLVSNRTFYALESRVFVYSAYLDERYEVPVVRIMSILAKDASNRVLKVFCHFKDSDDTLHTKEAKFYELCENHGKTFGGFILSCELPDMIPSTDACYVNITLTVKPVHRKYKVEKTQSAVLQITRLDTKPTPSIPVENNRTNHETLLSPEQMKYNYTMCIPPLFGNIDVKRFVEFIELNRMLGFQHFIIFLLDITVKEMLYILDHYTKLGIISLVYWKLPDVVQKNKIWYNGQLTVHNDCLYRAMSISQYLAIMDIDEFMVPHNGHKLLTTAIEPIMNETLCGLSFLSAFYEEKYSDKSSPTKSGDSLLTVKHNGRSAMFSKVRTKVLIRPTRVFEVGIHHVSKPAFEKYHIIPVDKSIAFLHHYRRCVPNFGMKCASSVLDNTMLKYADELLKRVNNITNTVLQS